ncbi:MAG: hypothetical protein V3W14_12210, partial [Candidatus Neomarinimicrobiota bacterium]
MEHSYHRITSRFIFLLAVGLCLATTARAQPTPGLWTGYTDNNWTTPGNWDDGVPPLPTTDVVINLDGATVTLPNGTAFAVNSLTLGGGTGEAPVTLESAS